MTTAEFDARLLEIGNRCDDNIAPTHNGQKVSRRQARRQRYREIALLLAECDLRVDEIARRLKKPLWWANRQITFGHFLRFAPALSKEDHYRLNLRSLTEKRFRRGMKAFLTAIAEQRVVSRTELQPCLRLAEDDVEDELEDDWN
jgi:hypothetical protein